MLGWIVESGQWHERATGIWLRVAGRWPAKARVPDHDARGAIAVLPREPAGAYNPAQAKSFSRLPVCPLEPRFTTEHFRFATA